MTTIAAACSSDDGAAPDVTEASVTTTTTEPPRPADGQLVIGVLLPRIGSGSSFGSPLINAVRHAVEQINDAGGVFDEPVLLVEVNEGDTVESAALGFEELVGRDVDAIIGPASSLAALGALQIPVSAGVLTCSPTATSLALDAYPDDGLFFRTAPSDSLQAVAIADAVERTGTPSVSIFYIDDAYGRGLADAVEAATTGRNLVVRGRTGFAPTEGDLAAFAREVLADEPGVVVVLGDADAGTRMLAALGEVPGDRPNVIVVNDAIRAARSSQSIVDLPADLREIVRGVAAVSTVPDDPVFSGAYAAHAYDCANLIALAAIQAGTDAPGRVATQVASVSVGGSGCSMFESCVEHIAQGRLFNYNGPMGALELSNRGDRTQARFERFRFDEEGRDEVVGPLIEVSVN